jgi:hypothetical protein
MIFHIYYNSYFLDRKVNCEIVTICYSLEKSL